jgi:hypothetical protein
MASIGWRGARGLIIAAFPGVRLRAYLVVDVEITT